MNETYEEMALTNNSRSNYMHLSNEEKGQLIFKDIKNSYVFWSIKKVIKDEILKSKNTKTQDVSEMIPRLLRDLNLETKIKNKVHEVLDKNGSFRERSQVTLTKFRNWKNINQLP